MRFTHGASMQHRRRGLSDTRRTLFDVSGVRADSSPVSPVVSHAHASWTLGSRDPQEERAPSRLTARTA